MQSLSRPQSASRLLRCAPTSAVPFAVDVVSLHVDAWGCWTLRSNALESRGVMQHTCETRDSAAALASSAADGVAAVGWLSDSPAAEGLR